MECDIQGSRKMPKRKSSFSCLDDDDMGGCSIGIVDKGRLIGVVGCKGDGFVCGWVGGGKVSKLLIRFG